MCFFKVKHYFGHISGMVGPIDVKRKGSALVGYWVQYVTLTFDLTHDLDLGCFKVKFRNGSISGIVGLIDVKWKGSELIWYWDNCMTLPFDHTHDLDIGVSRSESEIALSQEWGGRLTMNEKDVSHPFMTMILTCVTMVGWADVPDSDRDDFRRRRAVDISSLWTMDGRERSTWDLHMQHHLWGSLHKCFQVIWKVCTFRLKSTCNYGIRVQYTSIHPNWFHNPGQKYQLSKYRNILWYVQGQFILILSDSKPCTKSQITK